MRAVVQRVSSASVAVDGKQVGHIGAGLLVLLGVAPDDGPDDTAFMVRKLSGLRVFADADGLMNRSVADINGSFLIVSQFTLYGDVARGNRPSFTGAAAGARADEVYQDVCTGLRGQGFEVQNGVFGAHMEVSLVGDGPVTIIIETDSHKNRGQ
ncbi:D-aminoacyl-tRNA deacylase [Candidatus Cryosericum septentrionale]|jgi:D-tyrosyl-tRNA(Tyr) deacylase|uniref:D-aminoacyl-tRNA deacylase n=1 Tax=Candidatus Cryosericum septentrionale TaxID=2290913 RepID=A0A398DMR4_9BACT|nr:D-aminoacyl-tRNA deacylase [Candidatus Cryosericum septentrionale]RIE16966.1 D-tyrosyl-tRNA(Tyr) deacylase [Candidatus Cryosericum septentrionale]